MLTGFLYVYHSTLYDDDDYTQKKLSATQIVLTSRLPLPPLHGETNFWQSWENTTHKDKKKWRWKENETGKGKVLTRKEKHRKVK